MIDLNSNNVGITLMAYSRPDHLRRVLQGIKSCGIKKFSVYIDGADDQVIREKQAQIHAILYGVDWAEVSVVQRRVNLGLRRSIISAISEQLELYDQLILIEDDCVPLTDFFNFMFNALQTYKANKDIRSVCGYQLPIISKSNEEFIKPMCLSRFIPWGWGTWRDRWSDYNTDLSFLVDSLHQKGIFASLPSDIKGYCESEAFLNGQNNIWSLNWVLEHYLSNTKVIYPSKSLISNIGFDGSGVHCYESESFEVDCPGDKAIIQLDPDIKTDLLAERKFSDYMQKSWKQTMEPKPLSINGPLMDWQIGGVVRSIIDDSPINDFHTHLFPRPFKELCLSGVDDLLTYHYLSTEALCVTRLDPKKYFSMHKKDRAAFVWDELFIKRTPLSEAASGIVTILNKLNIRCVQSSYEDLRNEINSALPSDTDIFKFMNIKNVVMTNDPFSQNEIDALFVSDWDKSLYIPSLRVDRIFSDTEHALQVMKNQGFVTRDFQDVAKLFEEYLECIAEKVNPAYVSLSIDGSMLKEHYKNPLWQNGLMPWLNNRKMPLVLMIGVKRSVNPSFNEGGDGIGGSGLDALEALIKNNPEIVFYVAHLREDVQHHLTVMASKFPNMRLIGFWWFMNQPNNVKDNLQLRLDLLGTNFVAQFSDARVVEQLIYKWEHFKRTFHEVLTERYRKLNSAGWPVDQDMIKRDVKALLHDNCNLNNYMKSENW